MKKIFFLVLIIILSSLPISAHQVKISYNFFFIEVSESNWMNTSYPIALGLSWKNCAFSYAQLWSDLFSAKGHRFTLEYHGVSKLAPYGRLEIDHYNRSNQGGFTASGGIEYKATDFLALRLGLTNGWLCGQIQPEIAIVLEGKL